MHKHLFKWVRSIHKWLALIVMTQLLIWTVTGLLFGFVDGELASGSKTRNFALERSLYHPATTPEKALTSAHPKLLQQLALRHSEQPITSVQLYSFNQQWFYLVKSAQQVALYREHNLQKFIIDSTLAEYIAKRSYSGSGELARVELNAGHWQVEFADQINTQVIVSANTGRVVKHTNNESEFMALLKLLHFMDYNQVNGFNSWWIICFAVITVLLSLSGCYWLIELLKLRVKRWRLA